MVESELGWRSLLEIDHPDSGTLPIVDEEQRGADHLDCKGKKKLKIQFNYLK
jgi:hypothetical protein